MNSDLESFLARQFGNKNFVAKKFGYEVSNIGLRITFY